MAGSPRVPGNLDQVKREKARNENLQKMQKTGSQHLRSTFGINIGIAAILKQSQIFTGTIGTLFQILGAFIDVILASFMPIIVPALMLLAKMIPYIRKAADNIVGNAIRFFAWIKGGLDKLGNLIPERITNWFKSGLKTVLAHFFVITVLARLFGLQRLWFGFLKMAILRPIIVILTSVFRVLGSILAATILRGIGGRMPRLGGGGGPQIIQSSNRFANTATTAGRFGRFGAMAGRFGPMAGRIGLGTAAAGVGVAIGGVQIGMDVKKKNYWSAGGGIAGGVAGGAVGFALGGPVGAAIGASIGIMAGRMLGDALGKKLAENQTGQKAQGSYGQENPQANKIDYTPSSTGLEGRSGNFTTSRPGVFEVAPP